MQFIILLIVIFIIIKNKNKKPKRIKKTKNIVNQYSRHIGKLPKDFVVIDTETTGLSCDTEEIIQLSAIKYIDALEVERYNQYINPGKHIPHEASKINKIYDKDVADKPYIEEILDDFKSFIGDNVLVAHNASFDMKFIQTAFSTYAGSPIYNDVIDTLSLSRQHIDSPNHKLETLKKLLNIEANSHNAIDDCFVTGELYKYCLNIINQDSTTIKGKNCNKEKKLTDLHRECYLQVIDILKNNNRDTNIIRYSNSTYFDIIAFYNLLRIKISTKNRYILIDKYELPLIMPLKISPATKSEGLNRVRVEFYNANDIRYLESTILNKYDRLMNSLNHYVSSTKIGEFEKQKYLNDKSKILEY